MADKRASRLSIVIALPCSNDMKIVLLECYPNSEGVVAIGY